ncbi:unnamed protein product [Effrenium voratum]|nr:unnamed protein product [Effrenium voratum]
MSSERPSREVFRRCGVVRVLVTALTSDSSECVAAACAALTALSVDEDCQAEIAVEGGLERLVPLLSVKVSECLGHFALQESYRIRLRRLGAVPRLVKLLECQAIGPAAALLNLSVDEDSKAEVCKQGGLPRLKQLLANGTDQLRQVVAMIFGNLASQEECARMMTESSCDLALLRCLTAGDLVAEKAAEALLQMAAHPSCRAILRQEERLRLLFAAFHGPAVVAPCLRMVQLLAQEAPGRRAAGQALPWILASLRDCCAEEAAAAAWNLSMEETFASELCRQGGVSLLLDVAISGSHAALGALLQLAALEDGMTQLYKLGAVPKLTALLSHELLDVAVASAQLLTCMALEAETCVQAWDGASSALAAALGANLGRPLAAAEICSCAWLLCSDQGRGDAFVAADGLRCLCAMLLEEEGLEPVMGTLAVLNRHKEAFLEMGGVELLVPLLTANNLRHRHLAAKALCAVLDEENARKRRLEELGVYDEFKEILAQLG